MQKLKDALMEEQKRLERIVDEARNENVDMPEGYLRISRCENGCRYYQCFEGRNDTYISKKDITLCRKLAQKEYNIAVIRKAEKRLAQIRKMLKTDVDEEINRLYASLHPDRQKLIHPVEDSWEYKLQKWYERPYQGKEFQEGTALILTERGERVRSKSEKILADYFYRKNILYKYEKPLHLKEFGIVYPDFTFLSSKTGQEIYWEHEGMMDKPEYAKNAVRKIELYMKNGIYPGERLILTFETEQSLLNQKILESLAERYL